MWFFLTSRVVSSLVAFLYPGYASYKTLSQRPASEEDLERWLMYWCVLGCVVGVEYVAEWVISWIPFYYTLKTLFLLYIALPQTQGSSYLYKTHLQPFFKQHETQIDSTLARVKTRLFAFVQQRARMVWAQASAAAMGQPIPAVEELSSSTGVRQEELEEDGDREGEGGQSTGAGAGPAALVGNLWRSYGPGILAGGMALVSSATVAANSNSNTNTRKKRPGASVLTTPPGSRVHTRNGSSSHTRKRQALEGYDLDGNDENGDYNDGYGEEVQGGSSTTSGRRKSNESIVKRRGEHVRNRSGSGGSGKFEEVEVPSDVEGEVDGTGVGGGATTAPTTSAGGGGWFGGWGSGGGAKPGYERVKSD